ncbi:MAG TPA: hypothetical protein GXZ24_03445 [Firmicutes bacterium]|nr:hypothetical protein [Bacillota bacterium]
MAAAISLFLSLFSFVDAAGVENHQAEVGVYSLSAGRSGGGDQGRGHEVLASFTLLILDKITLDDLKAYSGPYLTSLLQKSSLGLMNVNTAGPPGTESGYLTIGAGTRLLGNWAVSKAYSRDEEKGQSVEVLYQRHSGKETVPAGAVLHPYTGALGLLNNNKTHPAPLGALGQTLTSNGLAAAVLGNADTSQEGRQAVVIAMNGEGVVAFGDVSARLLKEDHFFPYGYRCNAGAYLDAYRASNKGASLIVVEWGDTGRIDAYQGHLPAERRGEFLQSSFRELDLFLKGFLSDSGPEDRLVILVPSPPQAPVAGGYRLTPVVYYNPGFPHGGLLLSGTTRVPGIVANIDIAPTVTGHLGLPSPASFAGAPLEVKPRPMAGHPQKAGHLAGHLQKISALATRTARIHQQRPSVIKGYLLILIILVITGLVGLIARFHPVRQLEPAFYGLLYFPLSTLLAPAFAFFPSGSHLLNFFFLVMLTVVFVILSRSIWHRPMTIFAAVGLIIFALLAVDLLGGSSLQSRSFLGYDPITGARFYGIGNEYMGVMIGSLILGFGSFISPGLQDRRRKNSYLLNIMETRALIWLFAALSAIILFLMASPSFGANFGGAVTAAISLSLTLGGFMVLLYKRDPLPWFRSVLRKRKRALSYLTFAVIPLSFILLAGLLLYYLNLPRPGADVSHLGRALELVQKNGLGELLNIAVRKLEMNYKLVRFSLWTRALLALIALIAILYYYPVGLIKKIYAKEPGFRVAMGGIIAASVTALLANDSGVVAAATAMLYGGLPLLILALEKNFNKTCDMAGKPPDKMEI